MYNVVDITVTTNVTLFVEITDDMEYPFFLIESGSESDSRFIWDLTRDALPSDTVEYNTINIGIVYM